MIEFWNSGFNGVPSAEGTQFVELNATQSYTLYQTFLDLVAYKQTLNNCNANATDSVGSTVKLCTIDVTEMVYDARL